MNNQTRQFQYILIGIVCIATVGLIISLSQYALLERQREIADGMLLIQDPLTSAPASTAFDASEPNIKKAAENQENSRLVVSAIQLNIKTMISREIASLAVWILTMGIGGFFLTKLSIRNRKNTKI